MTSKEAVAEIRRRYIAGERNIVVNLATYRAYSDSLIVNERFTDLPTRWPWPPQLKFRDANVQAQVTA